MAMSRSFLREPGGFGAASASGGVGSAMRRMLRLKTLTKRGSTRIKWAAGRFEFVRSDRTAAGKPQHLGSRAAGCTQVAYAHSRVAFRKTPAVRIRDEAMVRVGRRVPTHQVLQQPVEGLWPGADPCRG